MIMGHSKQELSTKNHVVLLKTNCHITPLPPNNGHPVVETFTVVRTFLLNNFSPLLKT